VTSFAFYKNSVKTRLMLALHYRRVNDKWFFCTLNSLYFRQMMNRILYSCRFHTEFIELVKWKNILLAWGSHYIISFNSFYKFSI
jgi:hypothetical protein